MAHFDESEFRKFETKIDDVLKLLQDMTGSESAPQDKEYMNSSVDCKTHGEDDFIVKVRENRTIINNAKQEPSSKEPHAVDKFTFMQQMEQDAKMRAENRKNREVIADNFRRLGNDAFRVNKFEEAINLYTKAIDHIKDSPILYNNRALSYIKLKLYKRALIDCDYVINRLDEKNLRSWLYRAVAYYNLDDQENFEKSIKMSKKHNSTQIHYIEKFINSIKEI